MAAETHEVDVGADPYNPIFMQVGEPTEMQSAIRARLQAVPPRGSDGGSSAVSSSAVGTVNAAAPSKPAARRIGT